MKVKEIRESGSASEKSQAIKTGLSDVTYGIAKASDGEWKLLEVQVDPNTLESGAVEVLASDRDRYIIIERFKIAVVEAGVI
jgi:hypothetical protein